MSRVGSLQCAYKRACIVASHVCGNVIQYNAHNGVLFHDAIHALTMVLTYAHVLTR